MEIIESAEQGITILEIQGKLSNPESEKPLETAIDKCLEKGRRRILINLIGLQSIDSNGVESLLSSINKAQNAGTKISICQVPKPIMEILTLTEMDKKLPIYSSLFEAKTSIS